MKTILLLIMSCIFSFADIYDFKANNFFNKKIDFRNFKEDILVVFVSYDDCKLTKELKYLNDLYLKYKKKKVKFVGFAISSIKVENKKFCAINYGVDFDMLDKYNNDLGSLSLYSKKIYLNKKVSLYSPIIIYDKKMISLSKGITLLDNEISKTITIKKKSN